MTVHCERVCVYVCECVCVCVLRVQGLAFSGTYVCK